MALLHWWPLNGDLHDQGCSPKALTMYDGTSISSSNYENGKIGKCFKFTGSEGKFLIANSCLPLSTELTIACWVKTPSSRHMIWSINGNTEGSIDLYTSTYYSCNSHGDGSSNAFLDKNGNKKICYFR